MFSSSTSTEFFVPRLRQWTDQPQPKADRPQVDLAEPRRKELLTADSRRFTQIRIRRFHRRDAEYAEGRFFAQSGDDDWAKQLHFRRGMFLFVVVSGQTKKTISLRPLRLCGYILEELFFFRTWRALRLCASHLSPGSLIQNSRKNSKIFGRTLELGRGCG